MTKLQRWLHSQSIRGTERNRLIDSSERSSSNASRFREEAASYFTSTSRYRDVPPSAAAFKSRSRSGRFGTISAYDRTFYDRLIARYLTYMNTALPVINEIRLWEVAAVVYQDDERLRLSAMASSSYDTMPPPPLPPHLRSIDRPCPSTDTLF